MAADCNQSWISLPRFVLKPWSWLGRTPTQCALSFAILLCLRRDTIVPPLDGESDQLFRRSSFVSILRFLRLHHAEALCPCIC